jgi:hypothetical protein
MLVALMLKNAAVLNRPTIAATSYRGSLLFVLG